MVNAKSRLSDIMPGWLSDRRIEILKTPVTEKIRELVAKGRTKDRSPLMVISTLQETNIRRLSGSARRLEIPVLVSVLSGANGSDTEGHDEHLRLRELSLVEFDQQPVVGVDGVFKTHFLPGALFPSVMLKSDWNAQAFRLVYHACERTN